ncbi:juvenile hormone acid O-methyltransferase-like isoform X2 [Bradysia coprophila]|uniref:juvenile hormone acid O-methyltransferase-like isoform X2 n=1 Tax=Bradysia coprophila TaxID=38358 RepID=UPI00187D7BBC|nr:juvenile hormone acid O-methyltransferase-like isoform X2 [Bradysia coprophila]
MNDPVLYAKSNSFQKVTTQKILSEYSHLFQWREDGSMLDIGCGTGDATIESILPLLPTKSNRLIGCDISNEMIDYARKHNSHPNVAFQQLDIGGNIDDFLTKFGPFDHAASFFCLHWVQNQNAAMENISKLLTADGDCLLVFITWSHNFHVFLEMSKSPKWSQYMKDVSQFISPYQESISPADDLRVMLQTVGFTDCVIQARESRHLYDNYDEFANYSMINVHRLCQFDQSICEQNTG